MEMLRLKLSRFQVAEFLTYSKEFDRPRVNPRGLRSFCFFFSLFDLTVTAGIISAKGRGAGITAREDFLQTAAAINPGVDSQ